MSKSAIVGDWVHAHEQDSDGVRVFVPSGTPLPPSRGRQRLSLKPDGSFLEANPGGVDRTVQAGGTYEFDGRELVLKRAAYPEPAIFEAIAGSDGSSLELKKR
jgi:hypothetical protein